ncbi:MAG: EamA family transporter [Candidatus Freyarchaeota archaeon]
MSWLLLCLLTMLCWGLWGFFIKMAASHFTWQQIFIIRSIVTFLATVLVYMTLKPRIDVHSPGLGYTLMAGTAGTIALLAFYMALERGKAIIVVPLTSLYPVVTVVLSYLILQEKVTPMKGLGILLALIALILISIG